MKWLYIIQFGMKLFEVTQNWIKMFHLARSWMEQLLFVQSWFSLLEFAKFFQFMEIFNFTQIWMKLFQFAQISLRLLKFTQRFWFNSNLNKILIIHPDISEHTKILVWSQQNYFRLLLIARYSGAPRAIALATLPKGKVAWKWENEWVCRPPLNLSLYEVICSLFAKSECPIQISIFGRKLAFLWKSVNSIRHRRENGIDTLKLYHDTLLKTLKKHCYQHIMVSAFCIIITHYFSEEELVWICLT